MVHAEKHASLGARVPEAVFQEVDDCIASEHDALRSRRAECGPEEHAVLAREGFHLVQDFKLLEIACDGDDVRF